MVVLKNYDGKNANWLWVMWDPTLALVYGPSRLEYCIIVSPSVVFESMAQKKKNCPSLKAKCYGESMGIDYF